MAVGVGSLLSLLKWKPDLLYVHQTTNLGFLAARLIVATPTFLDAHSSVAMEARAFGREDLIRRLGWRERLSIRTTCGIIAASHELRDFLLKEYHLDPAFCWTVPNGVPSSWLTRHHGGGRWRERLEIVNGNMIVLHSAPAGFEANERSLELIEPLAKAGSLASQGICLVVSGRSRAPPGVRALGVVRDYIDLVDAADVTVLPYPPQAVCGGARNKALEFLARGKAIVSTFEGMRGVDGAMPGVHYLHAESAGEFLDALCRLRSDSTLKARLGAAARSLAKGFQWSASAGELSRIFESTNRSV